MIEPNPHLVFGIDMGMSCTGVAYVNRIHGAAQVLPFIEWPGKDHESKAPTILAYDLNNREKPTAWGYLAQDEEENSGDRRAQMFFKTELALPSDQRPKSRIHPANVLYQHFLSKLYEWLRMYFSTDRLGNTTWEAAEIEFHFSVPVIWKQSTVQLFRSIVEYAGFQRNPRHTVFMSLTEPQSVAAFSIAQGSEMFREGQVMLVLDAGGGTADLCVMRVDKKDNTQLELSEIRPVFGDEVGASFIDRDVEGLILERLKSLNDRDIGDNTNRELLAYGMAMGSSFQAKKRLLGRSDDDTFQIPIPNIGRNSAADFPWLRGNKMIFNWSDLESIFDVQIEKLKRLINDALNEDEYVRTTTPGRLSNRGTTTVARESRADIKINHLILAGGLGNSKYVQDQLRKYCFSLAESPDSILHGIQFHVSPEPQMAVCKGLVENRIRMLQTASFIPIVHSHSCRASYGIRCNMRYKRGNSDFRNVDAQYLKPGEDGKMRVQPCARWYIKRGNPIKNQEITFPFSTFKTYKSAQENWEDVSVTVLVSSIHAKKLPTLVTKELTRDGEVSEHISIPCKISEVSSNCVKHVRPVFWKRFMGQKCHTDVSFKIVAKVEAAEVWFEARDKITGKTLSEAVKIPVELRAGVEAPEAELVAHKYK